MLLKDVYKVVKLHKIESQKTLYREYVKFRCSLYISLLIGLTLFI